MAVVDNVLFIFMDDIILGMLWCVLIKVIQLSCGGIEMGMHGA